LSERLLRPMVEMTDDIDSITRLQLAATARDEVAKDSDQSNLVVGELRLVKDSFHNMKIAIRSWGKYVPWPVVQLLMRKDAMANLEVSEKEVSIFFSDIASFTTIVEGLQPESSLLLLSRYFHDMSQIIDKHGGIVLEFIGDAIMSIYGAPVFNDNHPTAAVRSAVEMLETVDLINQWLTAKALPHISIRCGVHTGDVLVGNMGFQSRMKYGIVGEASNIPGRLEELNKSYSTDLLISEDTLNRLAMDGLVSRPIDFVDFGPGRRCEQIFQVVKQQRGEAGDVQRRASSRQVSAIEKYRLGKFPEAAEDFKAVGDAMQLEGYEDEASKVLRERCLHLMKEPPSSDWDGVWRRSAD